MKKSTILALVIVYIVSFLVVGLLGIAIRGYDPIIYVNDIEVSDPDNGAYMKKGTPSEGYDYWYTSVIHEDHISLRIKAKVMPENTTYPNLDFEVEMNENYTFTTEEGIYGVVNFHDLVPADPVTCRIVIKSTDGKKFQKTVGITCMYLQQLNEYLKGDVNQMKRQFNSLRVLSISLLAISALVGCTGQSKNSSNTDDSGSSGDKTYYLSGVNQNANYAKYLSNIAIPSERDDGFKIRTNPFRVGDDNAFKFKPILTVVAVEGDEITPAKEENWTNPFDIKVEVKNAGSYAVADASLYEIVDAKECIIQFKAGAAGKTFRLTVAPTGVAESRLASFTQVLEFDVVDGYNIYDAKEIGLVDTRNMRLEADNEMPVDSWRRFKTANNIPLDLKPNTIILQHDVNITLDDVPADVLYGANDKGPTYAGTMRDWNGIYRLQEDRQITLYGNYFQLNYSQLPLITYYDSGNHVNSHSMLFDVAGGDFDVVDVNVTGNAKYATEDGEDRYAGGLMFAKVRYHANSVDASNIIGRESFITFMSEDAETDKGYVDFTINDCKFSNNYNSFLYNWGGKMISNRTDYVKCGGPVVIQDHVDPEPGDKYESDDYSTIYGHAPYTEFNDCKLENYVAGTEAWFVQFNVAALVGQIKAMSDFYYKNGLSFVVDSKEHKAMLSTAATDSNPSMFNLIVVNKSGKAEGETAYPVCGDVVINYSEKDEENNDVAVSEVYNYSQPDGAALMAYVTFNTFMDEQEAAVAAYKGGDNGAALATLFAKWEFAPSEMTPEAIEAAITLKAMELKEPANPTIYHAALRGANGLGAPVFQTAGGFGVYNPLTDAANMQPLDNLVYETTDAMTANDPFVKNAKNYTSIYYNGMMLVMGLVKVGA